MIKLYMLFVLLYNYNALNIDFVGRLRSLVVVDSLVIFAKRDLLTITVT